MGDATFGAGKLLTHTLGIVMATSVAVNASGKPMHMCSRRYDQHTPDQSRLLASAKPIQ